MMGDDSVSPVIGVIILVAIVVILSILVLSIVTETEESIPEKNSINSGVQYDKTESGLQISSIGDEKLSVKAENTKIATIEPDSVGTIDYTEFVNKSNFEGTVKVTNGNRVLQTIDVKITEEQYYEEPTGELNKSNFKLVSQGINGEDFNEINNPSTRFLDTTEDWKIKIKTNYKPEDFNYDWRAAQGSNYVSVQSTDKNKATYGYIDTDTKEIRLEVDISNGDDTITLRKYFPIDRAIQTATIESEGFNERGFKTIENPKTRFISTTEDFRFVGFTIHDELESVMNNDTTDFNIDWTENDPADREFIKITSENGKKATYKYLSKETALGNGRDFVKIDISHPAGPQRRFGYGQFPIEYAIQDVDFATNGGRFDNGSTVGYSGGDARIVNTNETFSITNIKLDSELNGHVDDSINNFKYNWQENDPAVREFIRLTNENGEEATYEYLDTEDFPTKWIYVTVSNSTGISNRFSYQSFPIEE